ncbi:PIR Superfamily Protein [Plasmodium ovale wallikeri]|uniref:PIR Superfamily Protein n=1 Tax=Plasmodium ovale wallikeri TaxID=864142 RepID=A0A1A9AQI4_PLAOA|nr:PIR Superfamily Protein [Plasmodium ovale wallikeri]
MDENSEYCSLDQLAQEGIYPHLKSSELYRFYNKFNEKYDINNNSISLDSLFSSEKIGVRKIYKKLWSNLYRLLKNHADFNGITKANNKRCIYLKFWFYDHLLNEEVDESDITNFYDLWEQVKKLLFTRNNSPCEFYRMELKDIKDIKKLYDYFIFYEAFMYEKILKDYTHNNARCYYLNTTFDVFDQRKSECNTQDNTGYCAEFKTYLKDHINENMLNSFKIKCPKEESVQSSEQTITEGVMLHEDLKNIAQSENFLSIVPLNEFYHALNLWYSDGVNNSCTCQVYIRNDIPKFKDIRKLCDNIKDVLENWGNLLKIFQIYYRDKDYCNYFNYWIHDKIKKYNPNSKTIQYLNNAFDSINKNKKKSKNYCQLKTFHVTENEYEKKKKLFEFLESYGSMRTKMDNDNASNVNNYCSFIKKYFDLYLEMEKSTESQKYNEEIILFQRKMNCELSYLKNKCPNMCLEMVFQSKNGSLCQSTQPKEIIKKRYIVEDIPNFNEIYDEFNKNDNIDNYCSECKDVLKFEKDYPGINELCKKLAKNLVELSEKSNEESNNRCEYFTHWIYDEMRKRFGDKLKYVGDINFANVLLDVAFRINNKLEKNQCHYNYDRMYSFEELNEMKYLHDYFKKHGDIENKIATVNTELEGYCEYVSHIYNLYKKYIRSCCEYYHENSFYTENCKSYFNCEQKFDPNKFLNKLMCNNKVSDDDSKKVYQWAIIDYIVKLITKISTEQAKTLGKGKSDDLSITKHEENGLLSDPFYSVVLAIFSFLGLLLMFYCLYKFSPLGSYMNKNRSRNERIKNSFNEENEMELLYENLRYENISPKNRRYQLAYHST